MSFNQVYFLFNLLNLHKKRRKKFFYIYFLFHLNCYSCQTRLITNEIPIKHIGKAQNLITRAL